MTRRITNASPLIFLSKLGRLPLLQLGVQEVLVPAEVLSEVRAKPDAGAQQLAAHLGNWLLECPITRPEFLRLLPDLGRGEKEVIAQALQEGIASVATDDLDARRTAHRMGLEPVGTVGLLLAAKKRGLLTSLKEELARLADPGFRVSDALSTQALREAGEE
ncbi:MAG: DUF3368 domain-containing protein [Chloroflexi bacterium]|nr:DUF3368 domain-containing protein [Chloroflexota bacterium]